MTPVYKFSASSIKGRTNYGSMLAGNSAFKPTSFESIATVSGTGSSGTISFSSIPATYTHLQIRIYAKNSSATSLYSRLNTDTGSNYAWHRLAGSGAAASAGSGSTQTRMVVSGFINDISTSNPYVAIIDILDYANTNKYTTIRTLTGQDNNGSGEVALSSGLWQNTAAVNAIEIYAGGGNFGTESRFALYGIKGV
jgi:hypothetical protein